MNTAIMKLHEGNDGQWFSPLRKALSAFVTSTQEHVTGKVRLELYKGNLINAGVWSPFSLYREDIATFAAGGDYKQSDATGFISIYGLPTKVQAIVNSEKKGNEVAYSSLCFNAQASLATMVLVLRSSQPVSYTDAQT